MNGKLGLRFLITLFFLFSTSMSYAQTSNKDRRIVGTWIYDGEYLEEIVRVTYVFNADGSGTYSNTHTNPAYHRNRVTFSYGISIDGEFRMIGNHTGNFRPYFSPDGQSFISGSIVFRKIN